MAKIKKSKPKKRYRNQPFLLALGQHCRKLRVKSGYSIDRMYKEGERLSTASIHRLETGSGDVQVSLIYRYAQILEVPLKSLFDFTLDLAAGAPGIIPFEADQKPPEQTVPYYSLEIAAGKLNHASEAPEPAGWVKVNKRGSLKGFFAARVVGHSMEPTIPSGALCLFKLYTGGSRNGQILVVQARGLSDPETGGRFVVKRYYRDGKVSESQERSHVVIRLISDNPDFEPIVLKQNSEEDVSAPAIFVEVLRGDGNNA